MTDKEQIEEMKLLICDKDKQNRNCHKCGSFCFNEHIANTYYNAGYRKVGEDEIVLTAEENSEYLKLKADFENAKEVIDFLQTDNKRISNSIAKYKDLVRKETAKEILSKALKEYDKLCKQLDRQEVGVWDFTCKVREMLFDNAKEYGVEIEE